MKLSTETLQILKNFAQINSGIWINEGNVLSTTEKNKNIVANAIIKDSFPTSFGIYDLNNFIGVLSLHKDTPELDFDEHHVFVKGLGGKSKISYRITDKEMLVVPPNKKLVLPNIDVTFTLEEDDYIWIINIAKQLQSPNIAVSSDGKTDIALMTYNFKDDSQHSERLEICGPSGTNGVAFNFVFNTDYWTKMIPGSYEVKISGRGIAHFKHSKDDLEYFIALEKKPTKTSIEEA